MDASATSTNGGTQTVAVERMRPQSTCKALSCSALPSLPPAQHPANYQTSQAHRWNAFTSLSFQFISLIAPYVQRSPPTYTLETIYLPNYPLLHAVGGQGCSFYQV